MGSPTASISTLPQTHLTVVLSLGGSGMRCSYPRDGRHFAGRCDDPGRNSVGAENLVEALGERPRVAVEPTVVAGEDLGVLLQPPGQRDGGTVRELSLRSL